MKSKMYGTFKKELAETVVAMLEPIQQRYRDIRESGEIGHILPIRRACTRSC